MRAKRAASAIKGDARRADTKPTISLSPASQTRAHVAHAPLRRLSEAALSGCAPNELLDALAAALRSALAVDDVRLCAPTDEPPQPGAALLVPVEWAGAVRHVAVVGELAGRVWTPDEILIAGTFANQAALGLALLESEQRRITQSERDTALARAANALNVSLELQEVLDTLAREADLAVGGEVACVYLLDDDGMGLATAGHGCPQEWFGHRLAAGQGIAGKVLESGRAFMTSAYQDEPQLPPHLMPSGICGGVGVPMCWNGELRGALSIGFRDQRDVTREDLDVLEAIADLAVVACHNAEAYDNVRTEASTDALTGLLNHGAMQVRVREEIARAARDGQPLCAMLIDLDDFKRVNDELGHPEGDALLRRVADALRAEVRPYDQVARYGGDEFVLVLPGTEESTARVVAGRVRNRVRAGAPHSEHGPMGTCSIGVAAWEPTMSADELLAAADRALLLAKRTGKGRVAVANPDAEGELARLQQSDGSPAAVHALAAAIEARDNYRHGHADEVVRLASGVAMLIGLTADTAERIGHAALLHDVGKLAIPHEILHKDGLLDDAEWDVMAEHPVIGERILRRIPQLAPLALIVRHEHEHWDGSGYPDGLLGTQIPVGSRIILACDAYGAMITERPYRPALTQGVAVEELRARAGTQFDPQVIDALLDVLGFGVARS